MCSGRGGIWGRGIDCASNAIMSRRPGSRQLKPGEQQHYKTQRQFRHGFAKTFEFGNVV